MERNLTVGRVWKVILVFTLPIMGSNLLQVLYTLADSVIVGRYIGPTALGAVGLTGSVIWLLLTFSVGIGTGTSIVVAQFYGAERRGDIVSSVAASYTLTLAASFLITALSLIFAKPLIWGFLGAPPEMRDMSVDYFAICASGTLFLMVYNVTYGILRAHGDSRGGLIFLLAAALLNVGLDLLFIVVFGWGVKGAAWATIMSQFGCAAVSIVYLVWYFPNLRPRLSIRREDIRRMITIAQVSTPIIIQTGILAVGFTIMQRLVNSFGPHSIEGFAVMGRIENLAHIPSQSFNSAISAFVGQNIGAGKLERAKEGFRASLKYGMIITVAISIIVIIFATPMLGMFNIEGESMRRGWEHLVLLMFFMPFFFTNGVTSGFLQGAGDVRTPAIAGFVNLSVRLLTAYIMAATFISFRSLYFSMPVAQTVSCLILLCRYKSGKWQNFKII